MLQHDPLKYAKCEACPLKGRPLVPGSGLSSKPKIAFVAEAPGETEVEMGVPLVGKSGQLLRRVLEDLKIDAKDCYFTNTCLCHPAGNATPKASMIKACRGRLVEELAQVKPEIIVTLGKVPSTALGGYRGRLDRFHRVYREISLSSRSGAKHSTGIVPTYHPAGVLKGPESFRDLVEDLEYVKSVLDGAPPVVDPPYDQYTFVETEEQFDKFLELLRDQSLVAVDVESDKMDWLEARILCLGFCWERGRSFVLDWPSLVKHKHYNLTKLNDALQGVNLIMHNGIFDVPFLLHNGLTNAYYYLDSMQAHYLLDERQGTHGLERLAIKYYNAPDYKTQFREDIGARSFVADESFAELISAAPKEDLFKYNGADADYTFRLGVDLASLVEEDGQTPVLRDIEMPSCRTFTEFAMTGLLIDRDYLEEMGQGWVREEDSYLAQMRESVGDPEFSPGSGKQLAHYLYDVLMLEPFGGRESLGKLKIDEDVISKFIQTVDDPEAREYWTSKRTVMSSGMKGFGGSVKGIAPRTTSAYMLYWLRQQHEFPNLVLKWRHVRKRRGLYYDGLKKFMKKDGRVHPQYNLTATRTGRKSTENPAIHNLPRGDEIYNIFIAAPGWCLIHADYAQAEMRMMAHYSGDKDLIHLLNTTDIHTRMAMQIFHLTQEDVDKMPKAELSDKRIAAKMITFGLPYGRSAAGLAPQLGISKEEAQQYIDDYFNLVPRLRDWLTEQRARGVQEQLITSVFGRRRRFPLIADRFHKREVERQAGNMAIQSAINDLTLMAYNNSIAALRAHNIPVVPGAHIHDSINFSVPKPFWKAAVEFIMEAMSYLPFESEVDFPGTCEIGERWGGMITVHDKKKWVVSDPGKDLDNPIPEWILEGFRDG